MPDATSGNPIGGTVEGNEINITSQVANDLMKYDGSAWVRHAKGTASQVLKMNSAANAIEWGEGGSFVLVSAVDTSAGNATSYTLSSLDLDTDGHYLLVMHLKNTTTDAGITLQINADATASNYSNQWARIIGATYAGGITANPWIGTQFEDSGDYVAECWITRGPSGYPVVAYRSFTATATPTAQQHEWGTFIYKTAGNVTSLKVVSDVANAIAQNSKITLYKLKRV